MADEVSWLLIEPGWSVVDSSGAAMGEVAEVLGDSDVDIFDGLRVESGGERRYVPAERVSEIVDGRVRLSSDADELQRLAAEDER